MSESILGMDLAAKTENQTGIAFICNRRIFLKTLYSNEDIINEVVRCKPSVVAIDAPLSLPEGRCCLEKDCSCSVGGHFRRSDREMRKFGGVLPLTFPGMKTLTFRGIEIKELINNLGENSDNLDGDSNNSKSNRCEITKTDYIDLIETHPRTSQRVFGFSDAVEEFFSLACEFFQFNKSLDDTSPHEIDGLFAAFSGIFYSQGKYLEVGNPEEGSIIVPRLDKTFREDLIEIIEKL
jgi:predicted nuclease with RNAse H fold